ncbi:hypothetical protein WA171_001579 [Blastocystis sp. BT1]
MGPEPDNMNRKEVIPLADIDSPMNSLPDNVAKLIVEYLDVFSLDCTNLSSVFPAFAAYRTEVLTDYYGRKNSQYITNRATGFLSPDHCRTPILLKSDDSIYTDVQLLKSHRRLSFGDD